jgi:hypothetical protein
MPKIDEVEENIGMTGRWRLLSASLVVAWVALVVGCGEEALDLTPPPGYLPFRVLSTKKLKGKPTLVVLVDEKAGKADILKLGQWLVDKNRSKIASLDIVDDEAFGLALDAQETTKEEFEKNDKLLAPEQWKKHWLAGYDESTKGKCIWLAEGRERASDVTPKADTEGKASPSTPQAPRSSTRLVPIKSYSAVDAWRQSATLKGERVRLTGEAEVKRTANGVYPVFKLPSGRRIATVSVKNEDAEPLAGIKVGEGATMNVNLETTVKGSVSAQLALSDSEFLPLDAPEGFVSVEEPSAETGAATTTKAQGGSTGQPGSGPAGTASPGQFGTGGATGPVAAGPGTKPVNVRGYFRKDGTYVRAHSRAAPGTGGGRRR